ncbi:MAG: thiolase family protein [Candidatus Kapaibacteriota bacterium]
MESLIISAARTPIGSYLGSLSSFTAPELGAFAIKEAVSRANINKAEINEAIMGNVLQGGVGQAPARQAAIFAGLPISVECMTVNKVCGSGLKAVMLADQAIRGNDAELIVAGGMESMSNAPYILKKARNGYRMGNGELIDMMIHDGLWDIYKNIHMGMAGELCSETYNITREEQDDYAIMSYKRALEAAEKGYFTEEIVPIEIKTKTGTTIIDKDEEPTKVNFDKVRSLRPAFKADGVVTAANASSINDGAAALVVASNEYANKNNLKPIAKIIAHVSYAQEPEWFTTAPTFAIQKLLKKVNMTVEDIDLFEVNEAFSVVSIITAKNLNIPYDKMNIHGGAVSLGHPIGASGARILTTLIYGLKKIGKKYGIASLCIGGGEANAMLIEMI